MISSCGVVWWGLVLVLWHPVLAWIASVEWGEAEAEVGRAETGEDRFVPFQMDEERGGAGRGAKPPSPRDVTGVGAARGRVPWRAVCRPRLPDITTRAPRLGPWLF